MELKEQMLRYRAKHSISQRALADKAGVTVQTICNVESGQQTPSAMTRTKIIMAMEEGENNEEG